MNVGQAILKAYLVCNAQTDLRLVFFDDEVRVFGGTNEPKLGPPFIIGVHCHLSFQLFTQFRVLNVEAGRPS